MKATSERGGSNATSADYGLAVRTVAISIASDLRARQLAGDAAWEHAVAVVDGYLLLFPALAEALTLSTNVEAALDDHPGGREWLEGDRKSAVDAVARHDILAEVGKLYDMDAGRPRSSPSA